jgi:transcription factor MBP1
MAHTQESRLTTISGTWVPLHSGRDLALRNGVFEKLRPIFDYVSGDISPPQAPKHTTAASNKPKVPKQAPIRRVPSMYFSTLSFGHISG